jgi:hypothetical protein
MYRTHRIARSVVGASLALAIASCSNGDNQEALGPSLTGNRAIFQSYVAIGNSITAGYQSSGINNAGQIVAYPALLAQQMGTRYAYRARPAPRPRRARCATAPRPPDRGS